MWTGIVTIVGNLDIWQETAGIEGQGIEQEKEEDWNMDKVI